LEIDHNLSPLPEFSVYANADNPYGDAQGDFAEYGVSVSYDAAAQEWTIDFGTTVSDALVAKRDVKFYIVIKDTAGNQWGSMYEVTDENTFAYTVSRLPAPVEVDPAGFITAFNAAIADIKVNDETVATANMDAETKTSA
jgi:beta-xylosidase